MDEKRTPLTEEEPRHRKKAKRRRAQRADHKHTYKTVLLMNVYDSIVTSQGRRCIVSPTKVCTICGRIGDVDMSQYDYVDIEDDLPYKIKKRVIRDEEKLEKWYIEGFMEKFAHKVEGEFPDAKEVHYW